MELDPWGVVLAELFEAQSSDYILGVLQRAGTPAVFDLTAEEDYSHKTRKRAYRRRLDRIQADLEPALRHRVANNIAHEVAKSDSGLERLTVALGRIGWSFEHGELAPLPSRKQEGFFSMASEPDVYPGTQDIRGGQAPSEVNPVSADITTREKLLAEIRDVIKTMPPRATIRHETSDNAEWFGRVSALIEKWSPSKSALMKEYLDSLLSKRLPAREAVSGLTKIIALLNQAQTDLQLGATNMHHPSVPMGTKIFIGHGRSVVWHQLKSFLTDRLHLTCDEFNAEAVAGITTTARLQKMLDDAAFAFLVMTADNIHADSRTHARENVIHEAGLFQGRLGFERAIILLEEGCSQFSNIHGLSYIAFPTGNLEAAFEKIRQVLEREHLL